MRACVVDDDKHFTQIELIVRIPAETPTPC